MGRLPYHAELRSTARREDNAKSSHLVQTVLKQVSVFAALLYFGGWIYLNRYYGQFDIDISLLELGWHDVIVHSAALLKGGALLVVSSPAILAVLLFPFALVAAERCLPQYKEAWKAVGVLNARFYFPLVASIASVLFFLLAAQYVGGAQARKDWIAAREPIVLSFKDTAAVRMPSSRTPMRIGG